MSEGGGLILFTKVFITAMLGVPVGAAGIDLLDRWVCNGWSSVVEKVKGDWTYIWSLGCALAILLLWGWV